MTKKENIQARRQEIHMEFPQLLKQMGLRTMGRSRVQKKRGDQLNSRQEREAGKAVLPTFRSLLMTLCILLREPIKP